MLGAMKKYSVGLFDPGDEGTTILQNYLPTDTALYPRRHELKSWGKDVLNYAISFVCNHKAGCGMLYLCRLFWLQYQDHHHNEVLTHRKYSDSHWNTEGLVWTS
jgi:hypothetical protein